jgi:preprotein translocase subunit SecE
MSRNSPVMSDEPSSTSHPGNEAAARPAVPPLPPRRADRQGGGPLVAAVRFIRESQIELQKVTWPTREQTINLTIVVIAVCVVVGVFLGGVDYVFQFLVQQLIVK